MKKNLLFFVLASIITFSLSAQQFQNAGFENWEDAGTVKDEPVDWSSIKTSDGGNLVNQAAPVVWWQSTDAHSGSYSVELQNILTLGTIVATGTITNGRIHASFTIADSYSFTDPTDARWNSPLTQKPDSVAIWVKYFPQGSDTARCQFSIHSGDGSIPPKPSNEANRIAYAEINLTTTIDNWTRIAAPFEYFNDNTPEYILSIITAGAGWNPQIGSIARYDDLELIYNPSSIGEDAKAVAYIYSSGNTIYLDKLPQDKLMNASVEILNLKGQVVYSAPLTSNTISIDMPNFKQGLYMVRVLSKNTEITEKVFLK
jgi:hypothetical protein